MLECVGLHIAQLSRWVCRIERDSSSCSQLGTIDRHNVMCLYDQVKTDRCEVDEEVWRLHDSLKGIAKSHQSDKDKLNTRLFEMANSHSALRNEIQSGGSEPGRAFHASMRS